MRGTCPRPHKLVFYGPALVDQKLDIHYRVCDKYRPTSQWQDRIIYIWPTANLAGSNCLKVVDIEIGGMTARLFHCSGSWPTCRADVAKWGNGSNLSMLFCLRITEDVRITLHKSAAVLRRFLAVFRTVTHRPDKNVPEVLTIQIKKYIAWTLPTANYGKDTLSHLFLGTQTYS